MWSGSSVFGQGEHHPNELQEVGAQGFERVYTGKTPLVPATGEQFNISNPLCLT